MHDQTGHRSRMRDRFRKEGLDSFEDVHVLELLLQYSIPRIDTKPLARELLNRFADPGSRNRRANGNLSALGKRCGAALSD